MATLKIDRGTSYTRTLNPYKIDGVVTSLVGATVRFTMKATEYSATTDDSDALVKKNVTNGTADGVAVITLAPADTATIEPGKYFYDIKVDRYSDGTVIHKVDEGKIQLDGSPSNRLS